MPESEELLQKQRLAQLTRWQEQLDERVENTIDRRSFFYYEDQVSTPVPLIQSISEDGTVVQQAAPAKLHSSMTIRKMLAKQQKALTNAGRVMDQEDDFYKVRSKMANKAGRQLADASEGKEVDSETLLTRDHLKQEQAYVKERLAAIDLSESAMLKEMEVEDRSSERAVRELRWKAQRDRAAVMGDYARLLPMGSKQRKRAMALKEEYEVQADKLRRLYKVVADENMSKEQRERDEATISRHAMYDSLKGIFRKDNPLAHEDATWINPITGGVLINVGRAFFGGTKPMYIFEDRSQPIVRNGKTTYKQYLFKEAVNCIGQYKPEGALVTEAAAALQQKICGDYAIPAFAAIQNVDGKQRVLGSFQERIEVGEGLDLFSWQVQAEDNEQLTPELKSEILREHTLDWLLCNFDTKGENFLHRTDGHLSSFDKEASFAYLKKPEANRMSRTFQPHANNTLYNALFTSYAEGKIDLNLSDVQTQIDRANAIPDEEYLGMFDRMLTQKYGKQGSAKRNAIERLILERKHNLAAEYTRFFNELRQEREANLARRAAAQPPQPPQPDNTYEDDFDGSED